MAEHDDPARTDAPTGAVGPDDAGAGCHRGWPATVDAHRVAAEVFAELDAVGQRPGESPGEQDPDEAAR